jgi:uncharacterized lipoprotein YmbA
MELVLMDNKSLKEASMPRRFTIIAAILLGAVAVGQAVCAYYGLDMQVNEMHVPAAMSWAVAAVAGVVSVLAFREGHA